ncbi:MAG: hypothetical protein MK179_10660 [Pirellulaceae bacterium]|nr:hypothetical protein [Pirellulaceae bacterium]
MTSVRTLPALTESPWFWICLFSSGGIVALVLGTERISFRQAQIEREYRARQLSGTTILDEGTEQPLPQPFLTRITMRPLLFGLGIVALLSWTILWWQRWQSSRLNN